LEDRIKRVTREEMRVSYAALRTWKIHRQIFNDIVPGALVAYDWPDLAATRVPRRWTMLNAINPRRNWMDGREVKSQYQIAPQAFAAGGAPQSFVIAARKPGQPLTKWLS
jgi:hypothetical protein